MASIQDLNFFLLYLHTVIQWSEYFCHVTDDDILMLARLVTFPSHLTTLRFHDHIFLSPSYKEIVIPLGVLQVSKMIPILEIFNLIPSAKSLATLSSIHWLQRWDMNIFGGQVIQPKHAVAWQARWGAVRVEVRRDNQELNHMDQRDNWEWNHMDL